MKKFLLSAILSTSLVSSASAWDFCEDYSKISIAGGSMVAGAVAGGPGGVIGLTVGGIANMLLCDPKVESTENKEDAIKTTVDNVVETDTIAGAKTVYFDFDVYKLNEQGKLDTIETAEVLKSKPNLVVKIEGNADAFGSDEYNMALGLKRAESVKSALINAGVTNTLETVSYGESKPACTESTTECFAKNRRVEFKSVK